MNPTTAKIALFILALLAIGITNLPREIEGNEASNASLQKINEANLTKITNETPNEIRELDEANLSMVQAVANCIGIDIITDITCTIADRDKNDIVDVVDIVKTVNPPPETEVNISK